MKLQSYTVEGAAPFPLEMLRAESAFPANRSDVDIIASSIRSPARFPGIRIELKRWVTGRRDQPLNLRWKSHGWDVIESQTR